MISGGSKTIKQRLKYYIMLELTEQLKETLKQYPIYSQDGKGLNAIVIAKFFLPGTAATWLVTEAEFRTDGDILFFGYTYVQTGELGYFSLKEMQSINIKGFTIERDEYFKEGTTIREALKEMGLDVPADQ